MKLVLECRQNRRIRGAWGLRLHDRTDLDASQLSEGVVTLAHVAEDVTAVEPTPLAWAERMGIPIIQPVHLELNRRPAEEGRRLGNIRHHAARSHGIFPIAFPGQGRNERYFFALRPENLGHASRSPVEIA